MSWMTKQEQDFQEGADDVDGRIKTVPHSSLPPDPSHALLFTSPRLREMDGEEMASLATLQITSMNSS